MTEAIHFWVRIKSTKGDQEGVAPRVPLLGQSGLAPNATLLSSQRVLVSGPILVSNEPHQEVATGLGLPLCILCSR
ncbi:hypothetical protein D3C71_1321350 [compost metagenome]